MTIFDVLRNFFVGKRETPNQGFNDSWQHKDNFRNPIWQNDEDDNDDDDGDFRHYSNTMRFNVFGDPLEITRYFESQMEHIMKNFFHNFEGNAISVFEDPNVFGILPQLKEKPETSLRDEFLKCDSLDVPNELPSNIPKVDTDLDGRISSDELATIWKNSDTPSFRGSQNGFQSCRKSVSFQMVRGPDGVVEERKTVLDCDGNITTTITKQTGDKMHKVTVIKDKNGIETKKEDLVEIDKNQPGILNDNWNSIIQPSEPLNYFPWHKFFGPNPKL